MDIIEKKRFSTTVVVVGSLLAVMTGVGSLAHYRETSTNANAFHTHKSVRALTTLIPIIGTGVTILYIFLVIAHLSYCFFEYRRGSMDSLASGTASDILKNSYKRVIKLLNSTITSTDESSSQSPTKTSRKTQEQTIQQTSQMQPPVFQHFDPAAQTGIHPSTVFQQLDPAQLKTSQYTRVTTPQPASPSIIEQKFEPTISRGPDIVQNVFSPTLKNTEGTNVQRVCPSQKNEQKVMQEPDAIKKMVMQGLNLAQEPEQTMIQGTYSTQQQPIHIMSTASTMLNLPDMYNYNLKNTENSIVGQTTEPATLQSVQPRTHSSILQTTDPMIIQSNLQTSIKHAEPFQQVDPTTSVQKPYGLFSSNLNEVSTNIDLAAYKSQKKAMQAPLQDQSIASAQGEFTSTMQTLPRVQISPTIKPQGTQVVQSQKLPLVQNQANSLAMQNESSRFSRPIQTQTSLHRPATQTRASCFSHPKQTQTSTLYPVMQNQASQFHHAMQNQVSYLQPTIQNQASLLHPATQNQTYPLQDFSSEETKTIKLKQNRVVPKKRAKKIVPKHMKKSKETKKSKGTQKIFFEIMPKIESSQKSELLPSNLIQRKGDRFISPVSSSLQSKFLPGQDDSICSIPSIGKAPITYTDEAYDNATVEAINKKCSTFGYWKTKANNDEKLEVYELQSHRN